jgi:hypothetical protein
MKKMLLEFPDMFVEPGLKLKDAFRAVGIESADQLNADFLRVFCVR